MWASGILAERTISGSSPSATPIGQAPTFWESLTMPWKSLGSTSADRLMPSSTTGPWNSPDRSISSATVEPWEKPTTTSALCSLANWPALLARPGMVTSSVSGAPAMPGKVAATQRTPASASSAITRS